MTLSLRPKFCKSQNPVSGQSQYTFRADLDATWQYHGEAANSKPHKKSAASALLFRHVGAILSDAAKAICAEKAKTRQMSSSPDPQTWVFPPLGAPSPPNGVAAAFGPIARGDKIKLQWTPASEQPDVNLICSNDSTTIPIGNNNASPLQYTFSETLGDGNDDTTYICHFFFANTEVGNTVTFQYLNTPASSSTTWQQNSQLQSALAGGGSQTTSASTSTGAVISSSSSSTSFITVTEPSTTFVAIATGAAAAAQGDSSQPSASPTSTPSSGISVGAGAGIGVAAAVVLCGLIFLIIWMVRRTRKTKQPGPLPVPQGDSAYYSQASKAPPMGQQPNSLPTAIHPNSRPVASQHHGSQGLHELGPSG